MRILDTSCTKAGRKTLKSTASVLGLVAGAIGWSGLANADKSGLQTLLLPDHYRLMDDGVVVFQLEGGEELSLDPNQYLILEDGLLLITDEFAQASMQSLPVMGSIRAQLTSELQPVRSPDGSVVLASDASPLWSGDGPAPRLFEDVDIQRFELAQNSSETQTQSDANLGQAAGAAAGGLSLAGLSLLSSIPGTEKSEQATEEEESPAPAPPPEPEFLSDAMFQALTPTNARAFTGSAGDSYIGYSSASPSTPDALIDAGKGAGNSATFDMSAGGDNLLLVATSAGASSGSFSYTGGSGKDDLAFGNYIAYYGNVTLNVGDGDNTLNTGAGAAATTGSLSYTGGDLADSFTFGAGLASAGGNVTLNAGNGDNILTAGDNAGKFAGSVTYTGGSGKDDLTFGDNLGMNAGLVTLNAGDGDNTLTAAVNAADFGFLTYTGGSGRDILTFDNKVGYGGTVNLDLGSDTAAETVTFQGTIGKYGGSVTIKNYNYNHDKIDVPAGVTADTSELSTFLSNITWTDSSGDYTITFEGTRTGSAEDPINFARLIDDII